MSELLKIFQVQSDELLRQRTQGATVEKANLVLDEPDGEEVSGRNRSRGYARFVLESPTTIRKEMVDQVLANPTILAAVVWDGEAEVWDSSGVLDEDVRYIVGQSWDALAETYG